MGTFIRSMDWSQTPLGPIASWPQSLRTTVGLMLNSNFPIALAWGPEHTQLYNDGYWPICGTKHPDSMGQDFSACWATAWPAIGAAFESALAGTTAFLEDQRMFLDRLGYLEETFFTFSFSPIRDETGNVAGLFHPVTETTSKMLGQRRTRTLRDLADRAARAASLEEGLVLAAETLATADLDLPFVLFYRIDPSAPSATLVAQTGLAPGGAASPVAVDLTDDAAGWPLARLVANGGALELHDVRERFPGLVCGPYPEPVQSALLLPIHPPGQDRPACIVVAGVSTRLPLNEAYQAFYDLLAATVTTVAANALAYEAERRRAAALAEMDRAKTVFFSNVSHEFRTPLTLILGPLADELAEAEATASPARRRERLETAHRNGLRLLKLVNTLLDFSRIEAGRVEAVYEPTDLSAFTADLAGNFRSACEQAGVALNVACSPLPEAVCVDRDMWEKIVLNLLSNAFKFTLAGAITVRLVPVGDTVQLAVSDTGVGIPIDEQSRIFERFHRVQGTEGRTHEGTGIGLALVKELVALQGGTIHAASVPGQGSTFTVTLPRGTGHRPTSPAGTPPTVPFTVLGAAPYVEEALRWLPASSAPDGLAPGSLSSTTADPSEGLPGGPRARILWADDNVDMRDYVRRLLADRYQVEAVANGRDALEAARRHPPDLVLADVMMPQLDGFGLLHELRADPRTSALPVILLSARAGEEARIAGLEAGADNYLVKPFSARELLAVIGAQIEITRMRRQAETLRRRLEKSAELDAANRALSDSRREALDLMEAAVSARRQAERDSAELRRSNDDLRQFAYVASHDLQEPLRMIGGYAGLLDETLADVRDPEVREYLDAIRDGVTRMYRLMQDLLTYARAGAGAPLLQPADMARVLEEATSGLEGAIEESGAVITHGPLPVIRADERLLRQVLANLIENAVKFRHPHQAPRVHVDAQRRGQDWLFSVRDNGIGIDPAYHERVFQIFQRLHAREDYPGSGLGLAICRKLVERLGGQICLDSQLGQGAAFWFTVPDGAVAMETA